MAHVLHHKNILQNGACIHLTRATLTTQRPKNLHSHDFYELFWVQNGQVRHHLGEKAEVLSEGTVYFIQPGQQHALQGKGEHALVVSLCIHPKVIQTLGTRHPQLQGNLFWAQSKLSQHKRDIRQLAALNHAAVLLEHSKCNALSAEAFLLPLCADLVSDQQPEQTPAWLAQACQAAKDPTIFRQGASGLVAITGKAHPHVSRSMRKYYDQTPSDFINDIRMNHAARVLITDSDPVSVVADQVGIPNMSHFHKLFKNAHGMTPLQYRHQFQSNLIQPQG